MIAGIRSITTPAVVTLGSGLTIAAIRSYKVAEVRSLIPGLDPCLRRRVPCVSPWWWVYQEIDVFLQAVCVGNLCTAVKQRDLGMDIPIALHPLALFVADGATPRGVRESFVLDMQNVKCDAASLPTSERDDARLHDTSNERTSIC